MEPDRQFVNLLDRLSQAHDYLRLQHERKVSELEAEVARLRRSPPPSPSRSPRRSPAPSASLAPAAAGDLHSLHLEEAEARRDGQQERQEPRNEHMALNLSDMALEDGSPSSIGAMPTLSGGNSKSSVGPRNTDSAAVPAAAPGPIPSEAPTSTTHTANRSSRQKASNLMLKAHVDTQAEKRWGNFDAFIGLAIIMYTAVTFLHQHIEGVRNGAELMNEPPPAFPVGSAMVHIMEHVFNAIFLFEFLIRVYFFRLRYVYDDGVQLFNIFDALLVWLTIIEAYILSGRSVNVSFIRVIRIIRLLKSLRVVRTFRFFTSLRILVSTVAASFLALFWSMVLLAIVMIMGALSLCQLLGGSINNPNISLGARTWVNRYYGTPGRSLYTMFELTFSGCWPNYARALIEEVSGLYVIFFIFYISGVVFAMFRIITALFLKDTLAIANTDSDMQIHAKLSEKQSYARKLLDFFEEVDTSGDGLINQEEFNEMLEEPRAAAYLAYLEIDAMEAANLFEVIDDGDGIVSADEFVKSALRLKGVARAQDLVILTHEINKVKKDVKNIEKIAHGTHGKVHLIHAGTMQSGRPESRERVEESGSQSVDV